MGPTSLLHQRYSLYCHIYDCVWKTAPIGQQGRKSSDVFLSGHSEVSQILHWLFSTIIVAPDNPFCCQCPTSVIITIIGLISCSLIPAYVSIIVSCLQVTYEEWFITLYNLCYSSLPVLLVGLLDQVKTSFVLDTKNGAEKGQWQVHY